MLDFSFEIIDETKINIQYKYGSEFFNFNLYYANGEWTLHPFDGILIQNREMCSLIVSELLRNKDFHVMLAKEKIILSQLRTSVNLQSNEPDEWVADRRNADYSRHDDELMDYIGNHSFEDILQLEREQIEARVQFFQQIIQRMFMEGLGPEDADFIKVQAVIRIYKETYDRLGELNDDWRGDRGRRRW
ncbi:MULTISPECIES: hypothetical protein [unclassified Paenibacillus]|uniref:hypothetical protein n=1 Tax=unclassified Paenibacillus TaxID=185978 RepID=UPI000CFCD6C0|nr:MULTISPECIES: hypothetical protein [unclassified Paenibacillus]PRA02768.1 hypothetical protein CQ043_22035 [Paenibacillus sp. MYb63]PRA45574.1 hypothetical protein CQ061_21995 [Paenibacillus sp. MYb67]